MIRESEIEMAKRGKRRKKREQRGRQEGGKRVENKHIMSSCPHIAPTCTWGGRVVQGVRVIRE